MVSELPGGWVETTIGEICAMGPKSAWDDGMEIGFVPMSHAPTNFRGPLNYEARRWHEVKKAYTHFENDDVIFAKVTPCFENGKAALVAGLPNGAGAGSSEFHVLRRRDAGISPSYLLAVIKSAQFLREGEENMTGAVGLRRVPRAFVENFPVRLPPEAEQKRIAQKLDALLAQVDTLKARIDAIPALLKRLRQAVRASALKGDLISDSKEDFSAWNECTLSDLASVETGKTPDRSEANYWQAGSIPWVTSAATGLSFCKEAKEFVTPLALRECSLKLFSPGTLLLAMYGEGKTRGQVTELKIQAACNQACAAISVNGELALQSFVKLRLEENYEAIRKMAVGGNQPNLNLGKVREIQFSLPSIATQTEIVRRVEQLFAYADQLEAKVATAKQRIDALTQSLLAKAFRGELVPQDPSDEPASALLERIRTQRAATPKPKRGRKAATS
ncbi:restriction endonuclease subunit S [Xanthomonas oryzae pv. oryzae]|nr:restriction endonuclease subunit S [Xanthomonas oryzae]RBJ58286.1 type I restriction endonuclease subunit S [Xanthomonas oryzae pv. oryzae]